VAVACGGSGGAGAPPARVNLVALVPAATGEGRGRLLVEAAQGWAFDHGAEAIVAGGLGPFYLWPGIDVRATRALCLAEALGYRPTGAALNMSCPTTYRAPAPDGVAVRRVLEDADVAATLALCDAAFGDRPSWRLEVARGIEHGACHVAADDHGAVVGFACHSVNRAAWVGPIGTDPAVRGRGVGAALLSALCVDLAVAGYRDAEISWIGPVGFYARTAGASISRVFRTALLYR
jgi:mycothiol synthase